MGLLLLVGVEGGVLHAQRLENALAYKIVEGEPTGHFDDARRYVDAGLRVTPMVARFIQHGRCKIDGDQIGQGMGTLDGGRIAFAQTRSMGEDLFDGDVRRLTGGCL